MKKLFVLFAAAMIALVPAAATNDGASDSVQMETKSYNLADFDGLEVSWIYHVELVQAAGFKVEVEAPDFVMPYLQVKVRGSRLQLGVSGLPNDVRKKLERGSYKVNASVSMPQISDIEMSGASKLLSSGDFQTSSFKMQLSGASSLKGLQMVAGHATIDCSGASKFQMAGSLKDVKIDLSGASRGELTSDGSTFNLDLSGSAKLEMTGVYDQADVELSAASHLRNTGALGTLKLSGSGAAKADLMDSPVTEARIELSGASSARLVALEKLGVRLSGAANCQYKAGEKLQIVETDVDRGASLKKL